jgi:hypothetical protein
MPNRRRAVPFAVIALCVLALCANACSFAYVYGPPSDTQNVKSFDCTDSYALPIVDTVLAAVGGAMSFMIYGLGRALGGSPTPAFYGVALVTIGLPTASAIYGYHKVGSCRDAARSSVRPIAATDLAPRDL